MAYTETLQNFWGTISHIPLGVEYALNSGV